MSHAEGDADGRRGARRAEGGYDESPRGETSGQEDSNRDKREGDIVPPLHEPVTSAGAKRLAFLAEKRCRNSARSGAKWSYHERIHCRAWALEEDRQCHGGCEFTSKPRVEAQRNRSASLEQIEPLMREIDLEHRPLAIELVDERQSAKHTRSCTARKLR